MEEERICKLCDQPMEDDDAISEDGECHLDCEELEIKLSSQDPDGTGQDEELRQDQSSWY